MRLEMAKPETIACVWKDRTLKLGRRPQKLITEPEATDSNGQHANDYLQRRRYRAYKPPEAQNNTRYRILPH